MMAPCEELPGRNVADFMDADRKFDSGSLWVLQLGLRLFPQAICFC